MELLQPALSGFEVVFTWTNLLSCLLGVFLGMVVGVLPGLGPVASISILLPITYTLPPESGIILLAGIFYGAQYGGTITSVLLNLPGEASSVVTTFDGYQMARHGRAGAALGISALGSFVGGTAAIVALSFLAPVLAGFALDFGPPEYAVLALIGITLVATLGNGSRIKCSIAALCGLLLATVGRDPLIAVERFTFGSIALSDGLDFVPIAMGLFGLAEILHGLEQRSRPVMIGKVGDVWPTMRDWALARGAIARGAVVGFVLGILPGGGATMSSMVAYAYEKKRSKNPEEFGRGAIQGVAAPETANNSAATSSFVPLLTLGIPANPTMALMFGALLLQGISPGPQLINEHPDVFWGVIDSMYIGNLFLLVMSIPMVGLFVRILRVRATVLAPITVTIIMLGAYTVNNSVDDMFVVIAFGVLGALMKKFGFEPGPLVLAFVLGSLVETSFRQSLRIFDGDLTGFATRPISGSLIGVFVIVVVLLPLVRAVRGRLRPAEHGRSGRL
jgi:putative tricarboxylic transport membrane protein